MTTRSAAGTSARRFPLYVLVFYLCSALLFGSGRLGSADASDQLLAAFVLVRTGQMGAPQPPGGFRDTVYEGKPVRWPVQFWWQAPNGNYYQTHDIGNTTLFLPIAFFSNLVQPAPPQEQISPPPLLAKVAASLLFSLLGGTACFFLFLFFRLFTNDRAAFFLGGAFAATTFFWAYCKTVWDTAPAGLFSALYLYLCAKTLAEENVPLGRIVGMTLAVAAATSFRYSWGPFLLISLCITLFFLRKRLTLTHYAAAAAVYLAGMLPTFVYNYVRMGSFWRPATTIPPYAGATVPTGGIGEGLFGLLISPNKGIFFYAPVLLLLFAVPFLWRNLPLRTRQLIIAALVPASLYIAAISRVPGWSGYIAWGPRYLIPALPMLYAVAGVVAILLWKRYRAALIALFALSAIVNLPAALVNWPLAITGHALAFNQKAYGFHPQQALWTGLVRGVQGKSLPPPVAGYREAAQDVNAGFPDLWLARLASQSGKGAAAALVIGATLFACALLALRRILSAPAGVVEGAPAQDTVAS